MAYLRFGALVALLTLCGIGQAWAACSTPTGNAGDQFYNTTYNVMQFCNGTNWVNMGSPGTSSPPTCTTYTSIGFVGPCAHRQEIFQTGVLQWDGTAWSCRTVYTVGSSTSNDC